MMQTETMTAGDLKVGAVFEIPKIQETRVVTKIEPSKWYDDETLIMSVIVQSPRGIERTTITYPKTMSLEGCVLHHNPTTNEGNR